ncbi:MAG: hypothetical protein QOK16_2004 [Solirubrobacteraceae bacterium]|nr:hypothetical protein [Solirubrobacteraceae bacterium]
MAVVRRAGASRLIDWTGERCVPWTDDVQVAYEHYHRYFWAANLTRGRRVLDLGSGEGFGSAILAVESESVRGIDIDERSIAHSQLNYGAPNLQFSVGSALELGAFDDDAFDVVVSFEVLEHLVEQERMLEQIDRVLAPDGMLIISTPDRRTYSEATGRENPFHARELSEQEFRELLATRFAHVGLWGQRTFCGSRINAHDSGVGEGSRTVFVEKTGEEWREAADPVPMYLVAVASRIPVEMPAAESTLVDYGIQLVRQHERESVLAQHETMLVREELNVALEARDAYDAALQESHRTVDSLTVSLQRGRAEVKAITRQLAACARDIDERDAQLAAARAQQARMDESVAWSLVQFVRWHLYRAIGEHSRAARSLQWTVQRMGRVRSRRRAVRAALTAAPAAPQVIRFPLCADPMVSIVIAAHSGAALTESCLRSISANTEEPAYEVIVVDDAGDADNLRLWSTLDGANVIVNHENQGYLRSVNLGASAARGRYVVPLNNDTRVQPGWLAELVARAESAPDVGIVVPMLLYPTGLLQEAGAIIFQDGSGWNFGRGLDPGAPAFNYVRDVDYGSGACLLVRADLWHQIGGYDERYQPMYYEDADLCFAARDRGYRVVYEPAARVVHVEGGTVGTDVNAGAKRHQELNRPKFVEKWGEQLATDQLPPSPENVRRASDRNRGCHVLVVDHRVPFPDRDAGSVRMAHMLRSFVEMGCRVTFIPDNLAPTAPYTRELQEIGVEVLFGAIDLGPVLAAIGPNLRLAVVSRPAIAARYFELIREHAPEATIAYDTVDLHFVREERRAALGGGSTVKAQTLREIELGLVRGADVTIAVTEEERQIILAHVPDARVTVVPMANAIAETVPPPAERSGLLFVGSFEHPPNIGAATTLVQDVMPLVWKKLGPVVLTIVGPEPPDAVRELAGPAVEVTGWVKDLTPMYESARVMIAPLLYGAGMKGKVTQSLAAGLPVVTTPIGAEGLEAVDGRDMMIAEDPAELAERIVCLVGDDELWSAVSRAGQEVAKRVFSVAVMRERLDELLGASLAAR